MENNPDLAVVRYAPGAGDARLAAAQAVFLPTVSSGLQRNSAATPPTNLFSGEAGIQSDFWSADAGLTQRLKWGGASYDVAFSASGRRTTTRSPASPVADLGAAGDFSAAAAARLKVDSARAQIESERRNREHRRHPGRERGAQVRADAEAPYWALVVRWRQSTSARSLDLALELERTNGRVDVGQSPPLDLVAARAEVAQRRENLSSPAPMRCRRDLLRTLIVDPKRTDYWSVRLDPTERPRRSEWRRTSIRGPAGARRANRTTRRPRRDRERATNVRWRRSDPADLRAQPPIDHGQGGRACSAKADSRAPSSGSRTRVVRCRQCSVRISDLDVGCRCRTRWPQREPGQSRTRRDRAGTGGGPVRTSSCRSSAKCATPRCGSNRTASGSRPPSSDASWRNSASTPSRSASKSACPPASSSSRRSATSRWLETTSSAHISTTSSRRSTSIGCSGRERRPQGRLGAGGNGSQKRSNGANEENGKEN